MLALGESVRAELLPQRAVVDGDDLRRGRMALRTQRRKPPGRHPVDRDSVEDAHRKRAHDRLRPELLARIERDSAPARRNRDRRDDGAAGERARRAPRPCAARPRPIPRRPAATPRGRRSRSRRRRPRPPCGAPRGATFARWIRPRAREHPPRRHAASSAAHPPSEATPPTTRRPDEPPPDATRGRPDRQSRRAPPKSRSTRSKSARSASVANGNPPSARTTPSTRSYVVAPATDVYVDASVSPSSSTRPRYAVCARPTSSPPSWIGRPSSTETCSTRPPTRSRASSTRTSAPPRARSRAAASPARPAPTTMTSVIRSAPRRRRGCGAHRRGDVR